MQISVNSEPQVWRNNASLQDLLTELGFSNKRVAVERNGEIVPRSQHAQIILQANDKLEIVQAIGGG